MSAHLLQSVAILQHQFQLKLLMSFVCVSTLLAYTQQQQQQQQKRMFATLL